jgi:hypothetical protein
MIDKMDEDSQEFYKRDVCCDPKDKRSMDLEEEKSSKYKGKR